MRLLAVSLTLLALAGHAVWAQRVRVAPPPPRPRVPHAYVRIAEALTSPTLSEGLRVFPRMFAASQLVQACRHPRRVERLEAATRTLDLQRGERFPLGSLGVVAVDFADVEMTDVPVAIEAEDWVPPVLQLRSDDPALGQGVLTPLNPGRFRLRVRTLCGTPGAEVVIRGFVT